MPTANEVHIDTALTNVSLAYKNPDYISELVAPVVPVRKQSDRYYVYDPDQEWTRINDDLRSPGAEAGEVNFNMSTDSYYCRDHALESSIPDEERDNADAAIAPDVDRVEFLTEKILLNQEYETAKMLTDPSIPGETIAEGNRWNDAGSDPIANIMKAHKLISEGVQHRANTLVLSRNAFDALANNAKIVERVKYTGNLSVTTDLLARLLQVDRILIGNAYRNTSGQEKTALMTPVWGNNAYMMYTTVRPGLRNMGALSTFAWTGASGATNTSNGTIVERWREARRKADMVRVQKYYDTKIVSNRAIYRLATCID